VRRKELCDLVHVVALLMQHTRQACSCRVNLLPVVMIIQCHCVGTLRSRVSRTYATRPRFPRDLRHWQQSVRTGPARSGDNIKAAFLKAIYRISSCIQCYRMRAGFLFTCDKTCICCACICTELHTGHPGQS
jgi:hypothetical protein